MQKNSGMRFSLCSLILLFVFSACQNTGRPGGVASADQQAALKDSSRFTTIEWLDSVTRDFGKIYEGQKLEIAYRFKNSGDKPLVIARVQPSCGCTVAEQPQEPIGPGKEGIIKAAFTSEGHVGINHKTLYVFANTKKEQQHTLQFLVEVEKRKL